MSDPLYMVGPKFTPWDRLRAAFPCGTDTRCPICKIQYEPHQPWCARWRPNLNQQR